MSVEPFTLSLAARKRKKALIDLGLRQSAIARKLEVSGALVSLVVMGRRVSGDDAVRVMEFIAGAMSKPVAVVFPEAPAEVVAGERRTAGDRRVWSQPHLDRRGRGNRRKSA